MIFRITHGQTSYTDVEYVEGCSKGKRKIQQALYEKCRRQFFKGTSNYAGISPDDKDDIFQDSYILLWEKIELGQLFVSEGEVFAKGAAGIKLVNDLTGYFMRIVKNKYLEKLRYNGMMVLQDGHEEEKADAEPAGWWGEEEPAVLGDRIVNQCVKTMPRHCFEILTLFYYEKKSLEEILAERMQNSTYDGLKSSKSKCIKTLKGRIREAFNEAGLKLPAAK